VHNAYSSGLRGTILPSAHDSGAAGGVTGSSHNSPLDASFVLLPPVLRQQMHQAMRAGSRGTGHVVGDQGAPNTAASSAERILAADVQAARTNTGSHAESKAVSTNGLSDEDGSATPHLAPQSDDIFDEPPQDRRHPDGMDAIGNVKDGEEEVSACVGTAPRTERPISLGSSSSTKSGRVERGVDLSSGVSAASLPEMSLACPPSPARPTVDIPWQYV